MLRFQFDPQTVVSVVGAVFSNDTCSISAIAVGLAMLNVVTIVRGRLPQP